MREKALSSLDSDISNILNSDVSDELKAKSYAASLSRFRSYSSPPKVETPVEQRAVSTPKQPIRQRERRSRRAQWLDSDDSLDATPADTSKRTHSKEKFGAQWVDKTPLKKKKKQRRKANKTWFEY
jgi:hypothetical protein